MLCPLVFTALADGLQWVLQQRRVSYVAHIWMISLPLSRIMGQCFQNLHVFLGIETDTIARELRLPPDIFTKFKRASRQMVTEKRLY